MYMYVRVRVCVGAGVGKKARTHEEDVCVRVSVHVCVGAGVGKGAGPYTGNEAGQFAMSLACFALHSS